MTRADGNWKRAVVLLALLAGLLAATGPAGAGRDAEAWTEQLQAAVGELRAGRWAEGKELAQAGLDDLARYLAPGKTAGSAVAMFLMARAIGAAGLGEERAALWDWQVAEQLDPRLETWNLEEFGSAGRLLDAHRASGGSGAEPDLPGCGELPGAAPPEKLRAGQPRVPEGARRLRQPARVEIEVEVGADGTVFRPRIRKAGPLETVTLAVADAMRDWRFAPARRDGEPVACDYLLTFDLRFGR
ncbi:MAG TPA: energy transducer TonB [Thermoanaerobaculia bacterium]|nr:energy transducer TonB [Thermoanaerobaculia bacterium]